MIEITIQEMLAKFAGIPRLPPYYRVSPTTYKNIVGRFPITQATRLMLDAFSGVEIRQDENVPDGEILPPEGWSTMHRWLETNCFAFKMQRPHYTEEDHICVMGLRSDFRVYYAFVAIPEHPKERPAANKALLREFNSFLREDPHSFAYTTEEYRSMVDKFMSGRKAVSINLSDLDLDKPVPLTR